MVTIVGLEKRKAADGKEFNVMNLQGSVEVAISKATGKPYLTARKTSIPCTFDEIMAKSLIGQSLSGEIERIEVDLTYGLLTDIVGNTYKTIKIGTQTWMAENLKTTKYNDGTDILNITNTTESINLSTPGYCWYLNDAYKYKNIYGALYNWYVLNTGKICPAGWHVPSNLEWTTLTTYLGGDSVADRKLKETGTTHWINTYTGVTNSSGFTALPGGNCWGVITEPLSYFGDLG